VDGLRESVGFCGVSLHKKGKVMKNWTFTQDQYIQTYNLGQIGTLAEGVCISLSCRWAKMILKSKKTYFGSQPTVSGNQRDNYFNKTGIPQKIAQNQDTFDKLREQAKQEIDLSKTALTESRDLFKKGEITWKEYELLSGSIMEGADDSGLESEHSLKVITASNKLSVTETVQCQSFSEYFLNVTAASCYIFVSAPLKHAFAGYVSSGTFSWDYYFFDPNAGEYQAAGNSDMAVLMTRFKKAYAKNVSANSAARRLKVVYTGSGQLN
jgi:Yersinia/Haemophilus virulence surface antigen